MAVTRNAAAASTPTDEDQKLISKLRQDRRSAFGSDVSDA